MYPSSKALEELERLNSISLNNNPSEWCKTNDGKLRLSSLNCRSLKKHFDDISSDNILLNSDLIALQETWLEVGENLEHLNIDDYKLHAVSCGRGKGLAIYYKDSLFTHIEDLADERLQISKFQSTHCDIIALYRS